MIGCQLGIQQFKGTIVYHKIGVGIENDAEPRKITQRHRAGGIGLDEAAEHAAKLSDIIEDGIEEIGQVLDSIACHTAEQQVAKGFVKTEAQSD